jgi:hypothetical protein
MELYRNDSTDRDFVELSLPNAVNVEAFWHGRSRSRAASGVFAPGLPLGGPPENAEQKFLLALLLHL